MNAIYLSLGTPVAEGTVFGKHTVFWKMNYKQQQKIVEPLSNKQRFRSRLLACVVNLATECQEFCHLTLLYKHILSVFANIILENFTYSLYI